MRQRQFSRVFTWNVIERLRKDFLCLQRVKKKFRREKENHESRERAMKLNEGKIERIMKIGGKVFNKMFIYQKTQVRNTNEESSLCWQILIFSRHWHRHFVPPHKSMLSKSDFHLPMERGVLEQFVISFYATFWHHSWKSNVALSSLHDFHLINNVESLLNYTTSLPSLLFFSKAISFSFEAGHGMGSWRGTFASVRFNFIKAD